MCTELSIVLLYGHNVGLNMKREVELVPFDEMFIEIWFKSHNDFMRKTGMNRSTFYSRIYGGWWVRWLPPEDGKLRFDLMQYKKSFAVDA